MLVYLLKINKKIMSNNLLSMSKIRQILRCYMQGKGSKSISSIPQYSKEISTGIPTIIHICGTSPVLR